jgi:hypothetical protein
VELKKIEFLSSPRLNELAESATRLNRKLPPGAWAFHAAAAWSRLKRTHEPTGNDTVEAPKVWVEPFQV